MAVIAVLPELGAGLAPFIAESCDDTKSPSIPHSWLQTISFLWLFGNTLSDTQFVQCERLLITEQASILKKAVLAYFKLLSWYLYEKKQEEPCNTLLRTASIQTERT